MYTTTQGILAVTGRVFLALIFIGSTLTMKIPKFSQTTEYMASEGVPAPSLLLVGAIVFLLVGSASVVLGYKARFGALLLFIFLVLAAYYFHDFWTMEDPQQREQQQIHFMKNLSMMGAMLFIMAVGSGPMSLDARLKKRQDASSAA